MAVYYVFICSFSPIESVERTSHTLKIEYLYLPAVRTQYSSEFGHLIRVAAIHAKLEQAVEQLEGKYPSYEYVFHVFLTFYFTKLPWILILLQTQQQLS